MADVEATVLSGTEILLDVLRSEGVGYIFGNPGSTELPLMDALATAEDIHYVLALQEATAAAMADGYAQVTRRPAFVNLHSSAGLGNAIGNLSNARANGTPLVVSAGQQDYRHIHHEPLLAGNLTGIAAAVCKWAHEIRSIDELATMLRRAFLDSSSAPTGAVFLSIPLHVLGEHSDASLPPRTTIDRETVGGGLEELADLLTTTAPDELAIIVGDEVATSGGVAAVAKLAEALGADVLGSPLYGRSVFPQEHALWAGMLPPIAAMLRNALEGYRRVLLVGGQAFLVYPYTPGSPLPEGTDLLHLSPDPAFIGQAHRARLGVVGDPRATLESLIPLVETRADRDAARHRLELKRRERAAEIERLEEAALARYGTSPLDPMAAAHALVRSAPRDTPIVDEAITSGIYVRGFQHTDEPDRYFFCRGGGLGWGMPASLGVSLGHDRSPVLCAVGDGSAMYSPQALWTAAHEDLPVVFAVFNNCQYLILKNNLRGMGGESAALDTFVATDIDDPPIDFAHLARAMGVEATVAAEASEVADIVRDAIERGKPHLVDIPITAP
ncbi:MAG: Benzoylformate decarboxylase [Acidimicrobiales bacterium]|nr:MAG: thiamine pyrophosphate-binding protein [Actinomycetota bacterium]MBV6507010.1 Benzoylformate decarboxylase [Acidimicrobiales bacterium]RIK05820.1 MAG: acetolactate synthase [Acidobacteriota bacterium]